MTVQDLRELLEHADPGDRVVLDPAGQCIWLLNAGPGMHQPMTEPEEAVLSEQDRRFLRSLHIR